MALFGKKKAADASKDVPEQNIEKKDVATNPVAAGLADRDLSSVIIKPVITEKAAVLGDRNVYTFEVRRDATKYDVYDAITQLFKVTPRKVNLVHQKPRNFVSRMRGRRGTHAGMKKAYVYLKDGDRIDLV